MKRLFFLFTTIGLIGFSCTRNAADEVAADAEDPTASVRKCYSYEVLEEQMAADPSLRARMNAIEDFTRQVTGHPEQFRLVNGIYEIPVVFNVLYKTASQNVSQAQLLSQIDVLNEDFAGTNTDHNLTSTYNDVKAGNISIRFVYSATNRRSTTKPSWTTNDAMKKSTQGIAATDPTKNLNIWVCNLSGGILGYAQFPGGNPETDGVVLDDNATGRVGTAAAPFHKGRTATHEVGHWLNLRHIWGDATCGNDQVGDTPLHNTANYGCPSAGHKSTCSGTPLEMTMNYMDYSDDACMYMFSVGQANRMLTTFVSGGPRATFAQP